MGKRIKFDHDKSYQVIAFEAFAQLYEAMSAAHAKDGRAPAVEIIVRGSEVKTLSIPSENFPEILEILRLSIGNE